MTEKEWDVEKIQVSKAGEGWPRHLGDTEVKVKFETEKGTKTLETNGIVMDDNLLPSKVTYEYSPSVHLKKGKDALHITKET